MSSWHRRDSSSFAIVVLLLSSLGLLMLPRETYAVPGDANNNGEIDHGDFFTLVDHLLGTA